MSKRIATAAEWFRCIGLTATPAERHAALTKLGRLLAGDSTRARPPISLPGQPTAPAASPLDDELPASAAIDGRPAKWMPRGRAVDPPSDADAREPYTREQLEQMNTRFAERLERAIASGRERRV